MAKPVKSAKVVHLTKERPQRSVIEMDSSRRPSRDPLSPAWMWAAIRWLFDSVKWMILLGIILPGALPQANIYVMTFSIVCVGIATVLASSIIIKTTQALSRALGLLACLALIAGPLLIGPVVPQPWLNDHKALAVGWYLLIPMGLVGLIWVCCFPVGSLGQGGTTASLNGYPRAALRHFTLAASKGPAEREQVLLWTAQLSAKGQHRQAAQVCGLLLEHEPENILFWRALASFQWLANDLTSSYQASQSAIELDPQNPALHFERGVRLAQSHQTRNEALEDLRRAAELDPNQPKYQRTVTAVMELPPGAPSPAILPNEGELFSIISDDSAASTQPPRL